MVLHLNSWRGLVSVVLLSHFLLDLVLVCECDMPAFVNAPSMSVTPVPF